MRDPDRIINEIDELSRKLSELNDEYEEQLRQRALAERKYKAARAQAILRYRVEQGLPANLADKMAEGDEAVLELKMQYEFACSICKAMKNNMDNIRSEMIAKQSVLSWYKAERQSP